MKTTHQRRRETLRNEVRQALTAQTRDGAGALELSNILDDAARSITDALLPREASNKPQARVVLGATLLARGLAILAERLDEEQAATSQAISELAGVDSARRIPCRCGVDVRQCFKGCRLWECCGGYVSEGHMSDCPGASSVIVEGAR